MLLGRPAMMRLRASVSGEVVQLTRDQMQARSPFRLSIACWPSMRKPSRSQMADRARTVQGDYAALLRATHEDRDELGRALVNDRWRGTALTTMPPDLLAVLPPLPPELEYRFVHRDLVLWDVRADLIVDVLRDAIPLESRGRTR